MINSLAVFSSRSTVAVSYIYAIFYHRLAVESTDK